METPGNPQHTTVIGGEADHHEKTSVFKRVRNKAKKIKETLTNRGNSNEHEEKGDHAYNELESEEESTEEAAEIQGAPLHESRREEGGVIDGKSQASRENYPVKNEGPEAFRGGDEISGKSRVQNSSPKQDPHCPKLGRGEEKDAPANYETKVSDQTPSVNETRREELGENFSEKNEGLEAFRDGGDEISGKSRVHMGNLSPVVEDPHSPKTGRGLGNETKVSDPARSVYESRREEGDVIDGNSVKNKGPDAFRGEDEISGKSGVQFENSSPLEEDMHSPKMGRGEKAAPENYEANVSDPTRSVYESKREEGDVIDEKSQASHENYTVKNEDPEAFRGGDEIFENSRVQFENSSPLEEDLHSPEMGRRENAAPENYETKVPDPASSVYESRKEERDVIDEKSQASPENYSGKNEGPEAFRDGDEFFEKSRVQIENFPSEEDLHSPKVGRRENGAPENYETEASDPTRSVYESKRGDGDVIDEKSQASRENYTVKNEGPDAFRGGDEISEKSRSPMEEDPHSPKMGTGEKKAAPENYETEVSDPTRSVSESRREEGDVIDEKSQASRGDYTVKNEGPEAFGGGDEISGKSRVQSGNLSPSEEDPHSPETGRGPENYETEVSEPTRSGGNEEGVEPLAQDFGALKVSDDDRHPTSAGSRNQFSPDDNPKSPEKPPQQGSYADTIYSATSVITGKAIFAKNAVASRLGYGQGTESGVPDTEENNQKEKEAGVTPSSAGGYSQKIKESIAPVYGKVAEAGSAVVAKIHGSGKEEVKIDETEGGVKRSSKGVPVSEFVAQKLRPGEEDKALSEVISDSIHKRKEDSSEGQQVDAAPAAVSPSMVGRIKGAVTSMFSKAETHPLSQEPSGERGEVGAADKEAHGAT